MRPAEARALLLDTHAWIWLVEGRKPLAGPAHGAVLDAAGRNALRLSIMSVWEVSLLEAKGRLALRRPCLEWVRTALARSGVALAPITPEIAVESHRLPGGFHADPADRLIVATARVESAVLVTRDRLILDYARGGVHLSALPC